MVSRDSVISPLPLTEMRQKHIQDQFQETNSALMELEKGLRSNHCGEQCEAVMQVPALLEKYPFPLLVNSAFLKLADVFRSGSNFMKLCVLKAIQSGKQHLEKIFNVDEFCRRFFVVIHSNDPIARAVTLRVFGNIASIASERKNIHHCICNGLDSHDTVEREAAIFALKCYAGQSSAFVESIWLKVVEAVKNLSTPIKVKLKLLPVFRYMIHDFEISVQVYALCEKLLQEYPVLEFIVIILNISTRLTQSTLLDIPKQIDMLLHYLTKDPRREVNLCAVRNLDFLARKMPHLWNSYQVDVLCESGFTCLEESVRKNILSVTNRLSMTPEGKILFTQKGLNQLKALTSDLATDISSLALLSRVNIAAKNKDNMSNDLLMSLENDMKMLLVLSASEENEQAYKRCLSVLSTLLVTVSEDSLSSIKSFLLECLNSFQGSYLQIICSMLSSNLEVNIFEHDIIELLEILEHYVAFPKDPDCNLLVSLTTMIMQMVARCPGKNLEMQNNMNRLILTSVLKDEHWCIYKIARRASYLSLPKLAAQLFEETLSKASSEQYLFWLLAVTKFQSGEAALMRSTIVSSVDELKDVLSNARFLYLDGLTNLKAAVTTNHPLYFQFKFARLRCDMLNAYSQLLTSCSLVKLCPPAKMIEVVNDAQCYSRITNQFRNCASLFTNLAYGYHRLKKASFNADNSTLKLLQLFEESAQLMANIIEMMVLNRNPESGNGRDESSTYQNTTNYDDYYQKKLSEANLQLFKYVKSVNTKWKMLYQENIDCISSMVLAQLKVGFSYPLYFYSAHQSTSVQLSITPSNLSKEHPYMLYVNHNMALQVEGVIKQEYSKAPYRNVERVNLRLKIVPDEKVKNPSGVFKPLKVSQTIFYESAEPRNDYFDVPFSLSFEYIGKHTITINTGVTDQFGESWETGPLYDLYVDVVEQHGNLRRK